MAPHWLEVTLSSLDYHPEVSQGIKTDWVWQPLLRFELRPGISSAVLLLCKHILFQLQLILRDTSCLEKCLLLAVGWHAKILSLVSSESIRKNIKHVPGLCLSFQARIDLPLSLPHSSRWRDNVCLVNGGCIRARVEFILCSASMWGSSEGWRRLFDLFSHFIVFLWVTPS